MELGISGEHANVPSFQKHTSCRFTKIQGVNLKIDPCKSVLITFRKVNFFKTLSHRGPTMVNLEVGVELWCSSSPERPFLAQCGERGQ